VLLVAEHDQFCDPVRARERTSGWVATEVEVIPGADHFLAGRLGWLSERVQALLSS
jgi:alpha/beta superfamily hydrolase